MAMRSGRSILMSYAVQLVFAWKAIAMALNEETPYLEKRFLDFFHFSFRSVVVITALAVCVQGCSCLL